MITPNPYLLQQIRDRKEKRDAYELAKAQKCEAVQAIKDRCNEEGFEYKVVMLGTYPRSFTIEGELYSIDKACIVFGIPRPWQTEESK